MIHIISKEGKQILFLKRLILHFENLSSIKTISHSPKINFYEDMYNIRGGYFIIIIILIIIK